MDRQRRKELQEEYAKIKIMMGVIEIKNTANGKRFIAAFPNLKNKWPSQKRQLDMGRHMNLALQKEWAEYGADTFAYQVLEEKEAAPPEDIRWEMSKMEKAWMEKLEPYEEKGYHRRPDAGSGNP